MRGDRVGMLDDDEVRRRLGYHPATPATTPAYELNRSAAILLGEVWNRVLPPGREAALALTALQEASMWANAAVATRTGPDWTMPAVDVSDQLDDLLEHLEGPLHTRSQLVCGGGPVQGGSGGDIGAQNGPIEPVEGADRLLRGDCTADAIRDGRSRCELVAGHEGKHRRGSWEWE